MHVWRGNPALLLAAYFLELDQIIFDAPVPIGVGLPSLWGFREDVWVSLTGLLLVWKFAGRLSFTLGVPPLFTRLFKLLGRRCVLDRLG